MSRSALLPVVPPVFTARLLAAGALTLILTACGGGGGGGGGGAPSTGSNEQVANQKVTTQQVTYPEDDNDARRFLTQATFGPTQDAMIDLNTRGIEPWLTAQLAMPQTQTHLAYVDARDAIIKQTNASASSGVAEVAQSFWSGALNGKDQLRQRVAFALSEIFVASMNDSCGFEHPRGMASYYDMLADNAFGSFRNLLEKVAMHPIMGCYLSHLKNQRENASTGRVPDENFAREVMQLFTIGLYQLKADGTQVLDASGNPIETYTANDVAGLAKVFTGFSYDCADGPTEVCFHWAINAGVADKTVWTRPMRGYQAFHSYAVDKNFLGVSIKATAKPDPAADLKTALDFLALTHPNVGPFIGKQLIQRLVTSNPSAAYVGRVTAAFEASGRNLGAMVKAILTDPEARSMATATDDANHFGKVREPILKLSAFLRAMEATSDSGMFMIDTTDDANSLSQTPMKAPSVFNYFRPGYVVPGGESKARGMVAPELQIANESSVAGYITYMKNGIPTGFGRYQANANGVARHDIQLPFNLSTSNEWYVLAKAADAGPLIEQLNQRLMYGAMPAALRSEIETAVESIAFSATPTDAQIKNRMWAAMLLTVASPEFQIQK